MKKKNDLRVCLLLVLAGMLAAGPALTAQDKDAEWDRKTGALAQKLAEFVPQPVPGLIDNMPGEPKGRGTWTYSACSETGGCEQDYAPIAAGRTWRFEDPALAKQIEAAWKKHDALQERQRQGRPAEAADLERERMTESSEKNQAAIAKYSAQVGELTNKFSDPNLNDKQREQLGAQIQELQKKMEKLEQQHQATMATMPKPAGVEEGEKLGKQLKDQRDSERRLEFRLGGNETLESVNGVLKSRKPVRSGTLKGHPFYRDTQTLTGPALPEHVYLAVLVGPENFKNALQGGELRAELKTIWVSASIRSTPQSVKADEAMARQLLEKVDYDGLAKLLQP